MLLYLLQGLALGFSAAASPGPLQAFLIHRALHSGWRRAAPVAFAPLLSDPPIILLIVFLLDQIPDWALRGLGLVGGFFIFYLVWGMWRDWRRVPSPEPEGQTVNSLRKAIFINLLSPGPYLFWTLICGPLLLEAGRRSIGHAAAFLAGFYGLFILMNLLLALTFDAARRLGAKVTRALTLSSIVVLAVFGLLLIGRALVALR